MSNLIWLIPAVSIIFSAAVVMIDRYQKKRTMDRIGEMLDKAKEGGFSESEFSESRLSALEAKFAGYLSASYISARNVAEEKERVETLVADISHQTKTPVANLILYSELLAEENLSEEQNAYVNALRQQAERLRFLIDSLVKLSRLENGILKLSPKKNPIQPMLQQVYMQFLQKAEDKGLKLSLQSTGVSACFDMKWTAEALGNILDNAIKYTCSGGITISAKEYPLFIRIDVTDTGDGIAEEEQSKIFSRFYRSENVRDSDGVGIGLFLAREIISGEGGYIKVASKPGQGAMFSVFLPG